MGDHVDDVSRILAPLWAHRRVLPGANAHADTIAPVHIDRVRAFVDARAPITMVLPAFPAKSPSLRKVLGPLPDRAERLSLRFLASLVDEIAAVYAPGARLVLCSDGAVFADAVGVTDDAVRAYRSALARIIDNEPRITLFHLGDAFPSLDPPEARAALFAKWARTPAEIHERAPRAQLNGIHRFLFEELMLAEPALTRSRARSLTRDRAVEVVRRSDAWSRLVDDAFPGGVRLSIHPQPAGSDKLGIHVMGGARGDAWLTPWHGVAVLREGAFALMKRADAEALGAHVVLDDGRPSHMEIA